MFHTASPVHLSAYADPQHDLIEPAIEGTKNILASVTKHKDTIRKVVLTSSIVGEYITHIHINVFPLAECWVYGSAHSSAQLLPTQPYQSPH
eukprot:jgi/Chrzof1/1847/Cz10g23160.t1